MRPSSGGSNLMSNWFLPACAEAAISTASPLIGTAGGVGVPAGAAAGAAAVVRIAGTTALPMLPIAVAAWLLPACRLPGCAEPAAAKGDACGVESSAARAASSILLVGAGLVPPESLVGLPLASRLGAAFEPALALAPVEPAFGSTLGPLCDASGWSVAWLFAVRSRARALAASLAASSSALATLPALPALA